MTTATVIRQDWHVARKQHHCHGCGYAISPGQEYQAVTFRGLQGLIFAKLDKDCAPHMLQPYGDCDYSVTKEPHAPWGGETKAAA